MTNRYKFSRMSQHEFSDALYATSLSLNDFCWLTGVSYRRANRWRDGADPDIPHHVRLLLFLLTLPGARNIAEKLSTDNLLETINDDDRVTRDRDAAE